MENKKVGSGRPFAWILVGSMAIVVVMIIGTIWYVNYEVSKSNQKWCELLTSLDNPVPPDPSNKRAVDNAIKFHRLRINLGC